MDGGCIAYLVDMWVVFFASEHHFTHPSLAIPRSLTTFALVAYSFDIDKEYFAGVSQSINITYHSPAVACVSSPCLYPFPALLIHMRIIKRGQVANHQLYNCRGGKNQDGAL